MIKILPINKKPSMRTYTHHAFLHSIISSDDKVEKNEQSITEFSVVDYELREWKCEKRNIRYECVDNNFVVWGNKWNTDMDVVFWRPCRNLDSIEIEIHKQLYSNVWSGISIFITKKNTDMINNIVCTDVRVGSFSKDGVYFVLANQSHKVLKRNWLNNRIKLIREDQSVYMLFQETEEVSRIDLVESLDSEEYVIGFAATFGCNSFYEWKFSNYINVAINFNRPVIMDFIWNTNKNWSPHSSDYFIDYQCEDRDSVNLFGYSELDFVKQMIQAGRYIEVEINNNLNVGISDEEGPVFHQNLIYGFDDEKACLYLLYVKYGQIVTNQLAYEEFESERNQQYNRKYYVYRYNPGYEGWNLSVSHILQLFEEFSSSINISNYFSGQEEYFCGINCYRELLSEKGINVIKRDIRISHLLYERAVCNKERIEYLVEKGLLQKDNVEFLCDIINDECIQTLALRNYILKKRFGGGISDDRVKNYLMCILNEEEMFTDAMIGCLKSIQ